MSSKAGRSYHHVQSKLRQVTEEYFGYLTSDTSIPNGERERLLAQDIQVFFCLARIYKDQSTVGYLNELLERETVPIAYEKKVKRQEKVRTNGHSRRKKVTVPKKKKEPVKKRGIQLPPGFKPLEQILRECDIDGEMLAAIAENTCVDLETHETEGASVKGMSAASYAKVKEYVDKLRS